MQPIRTTKKEFPSLLNIINKAVDKAIKEYEEKQKTINKSLTK